jgi:hypothetical protein
VRFGPWIPIEEAAAQAPGAVGVVQARAPGLLPLPRGKSAMVWYAASAPGVALDVWLQGPGGATLDRAVQLGARLARFADCARRC